MSATLDTLTEAKANAFDDVEREAENAAHVLAEIRSRIQRIRREGFSKYDCANVSILYNLPEFDRLDRALARYAIVNELVFRAHSTEAYAERERKAQEAA